MSDRVDSQLPARPADRATLDAAKDIFADVADLPANERSRAVDDRCGGNAELRQAVVSLIDAHESAGRFMANPALAYETTGAPQGADGAPVFAPSARVDDQDSIPRLIDPHPAPRPSRLLKGEAGSQIGRYKLLRIIGEGGFGTVYLAEQRQPIRRQVAVKVIKPGMDTQMVIARFEAERQALAMMDHPNIARVLDAGATDTGRPYFVMEFVDGVPLGEYCDRNRVPTRQRLELFIDICHAVQHAHLKGIIHRDLKPSNVLVSLHEGKPVPKVIDFGIAKATQQRLTDKTVLTELRTLLGTPEYMSPEQAEMSGIDVDTRSDIYSLGVILYELLIGATPFDPKRLRTSAFGEIQRIIREEEPLRPSTKLRASRESLRTIASMRNTDPGQLSRVVRGDLDWIVMKCLEKDRTRRYQTAIQLALDVERYLQDKPISASPPSQVYAIRKLVRRHRIGLSMAATVLIVLLAGIATATWQAIRATRAEQVAAAERDEANRAKQTAEEARNAAEAARALAVENEATALKEANRANAVQRALVDMLETANPDARQGKTLSVQEMLRQYASRVGNKLAGHPEAEAIVRLVIGRALRQMYGHEEAGPQYRRAVELYRSVPHPPRIDFAHALFDAATAALDDNQPDQAIPLLLEAKALYEQGGKPASMVTNCMTHIGIAYRQKYDLITAEQWLRWAIENADQVNDRSQRMFSLKMLAMIVSERGNAEEVKRVNQRLEEEDHAGRSGTVGAERPPMDWVDSSNNQTYIDRTIAAMESAIGSGKRRFFPDYFALANAAIELRSTNVEKADADWSRICDLFTQLESADQVRPAHKLSMLRAQARYIAAKGDTEGAIAILRQALQAMEYGRLPLDQAGYLELGHYLQDAGRADEAEDVWLAGVERCRSLGETAAPAWMHLPRVLGEFYAGQGNHNRSGEMFAYAADVHSRLKGDQTGISAKLALRAAHERTSAGDFNAAHDSARIAILQSSDLLPDAEREVVDGLTDLAHQWQSSGEVDRAAQLLQQLRKRGFHDAK